jgi:type IV pilus assembly protein PilV
VRLQLSAVQISQQNNRYSAALILANEIAEKISGNRASTLDSFNNPFLAVDFNASTDKIDSTSNCYETTCTTEQLARANIAEWLKKTSSALPEVRAKICLDDMPWEEEKNSYTWECQTTGSSPSTVIKLGWTEKKAPETSLAPRISLPVPVHLN